MTRQKSLAMNVLAAAATLACIGTASAQTNDTYNPSAYILLNGSAIKPDSKFPEDKVGYGGGVKIGIPLSPSWDLQIGGNYARSKDNGSKMHEYLGGVDALYLFTPAGFRPFVLVGVGASRDSISDPLVGIVAPHFALRQRGRRLPVQVHAHVRHAGRHPRDGFVLPPSHTVDGMKHAANTYANVGFTWAFGAPPAPPVVPVVTTTRTEETTVATTPAPAPVVTPPPRRRRRLR